MQLQIHTSYYACHAGKFLSLHGLSLSIDLGRLQAFITTNYANWSIRLLNLLSLEHILYRIREQSNTTYYAVPGDHILKSHGACKFVHTRPVSESIIGPIKAQRRAYMGPIDNDGAYLGLQQALYQYKIPMLSPN